MRPRLLLLDTPHPKAREIMESVAECYNRTYDGEENMGIFDMFYTQLTPIKVMAGITPVFCPCTGIDHIQAPKIIHLDDQWKANEGREITSTAEHTWSLVLRLAKKAKLQLNRKTLLVIGGNGRVGNKVVEYGLAFGMHVISHEKIEGYEHLLSVLPVADVITINIPLENNKNAIGEKEISAIKNGAILVNTSRQKIVDIYEVLKRLKDKTMYYADDFKNDIDLTIATITGNVIQTPHIAGNTVDSRMLTDIFIANKIKEYIERGCL